MIWLGLLSGCGERPPTYQPNGDAVVSGCLVMQPSKPVGQYAWMESTLYRPVLDAQLTWDEAASFGEAPDIRTLVYDSKTNWFATLGERKRPLGPGIGETVTESVVVAFDASGVIVGLGRTSTFPSCPVGRTLDMP